MAACGLDPAGASEREQHVTRRLVVVGGDAGGMSAAAQARRMTDPKDFEIVAFERGEHTSYAACGLPYRIAREVDSVDDLVARSPEEFRRSGIDVRTRHEVISIDTEARTVEVRDLDRDAVSTERYDELLIATGASPLRPPLPGIDSLGVFDLRTIPDLVALDAALDGASTAVVVGAGYIGLEVAEAFVARGLGVSVVEAAARPMTTLDSDMADLVSVALENMGVELHLGSAVRSFRTGDDGSVSAVVTDRVELPADVVVVGLGARPNTSLARAAGIPVGGSGGIVVDRRQRSRVDHVWATGDCVESFHRVSRRGVSIALGTHANKQGRVAGTNLAGGYATFGGVIGTAITRVGDVEVARTGLNESEATAAGFEHVSATARSAVRAHYYQGAGHVVVKLVAERGTGRLLGGQIVGSEGAGKRIDVLAMAVWSEMTVGELGAVDLAYAPPFAPVWDPVLLAAGRTAAAVEAAR